METFPMQYFRISTRYPESGSRIQLGNSYQFDTPPAAPDQRIFVLTLPGVAYFTTSPGDTIDLTASPERNAAVLEEFYNNHKRAYPFTFNHPVHGALTCKFNRPLELPQGIPGGNGVLEDIEIELIEVP